MQYQLIEFSPIKNIFFAYLMTQDQRIINGLILQCNDNAVGYIKMCCLWNDMHQLQQPYGDYCSCFRLPLGLIFVINTTSYIQCML